MTEATTQTEFSYEELSDKAKEKVRARHSEYMDSWWDYIDADFRERGEERGFEVEDMRFSGFWSQGDGALWTGTINMPRFISYHISDTHPDHHRYQILLMLLEEDWLDHRVHVSQVGFHYSHSGCMRISTDLNNCAVFDLQEGDGATLHDGVMKGANVYQLWMGISGEGLLFDLDELFINKAREYADALYKELEEEYEYLTSDEAVAQDCYINGRRFTEDGKEI